MNRPLRAALVALLTGVLAGLGGCSWLKGLNPFDGDDEELGPAELVEFEPEGRLRADWRATIGDGLGDLFTQLVPARVGNTLYVADAYGQVEARSLGNGNRRWETRIGTPEGGLLGSLVFWGRNDDDGSFVTGGVSADRDHVFLGTEHGELVALRSEDGEELWRSQLSSEVLAPAAIGGGHVFVMTLDGRLTALDVADGERVWSYDTQVPVLTLRGTGIPVYSDPLVFAGFANGRLTALRGENGEALWEHAVALPSGRSELERIADVDQAPLVTPSGAYVASYQGAIKSLRLQDGAVQWERPVSSYGSLATGYGQVYVTDEDGVLQALDSTTGNVVWSQDMLLRRGVTGAGVFGPYVAVGDFEGYVHVFAQSDGRLVGRERIDGDGIRIAPIGVDDRLVVLGNSGRLAVLRFARAE